MEVYFEKKLKNCFSDIQSSDLRLSKNVENKLTISRKLHSLYLENYFVRYVNYLPEA